MADSVTIVTPQPMVRVAWRPEQHNRVTNGTFETNTSGWSTTTGVNAAAGTSIIRITTDSHSGSACASVVTTDTGDSGVHWDFGSDTFFSEATYGAMYQVTVWLKRVSGGRVCWLTLGSEGTTTDRARRIITDLPESWTPYTIRWLPMGNQTDVQLAISTGTQEVLTVLVDDVSVSLVDTFSQVENGTFDTDTTGWSAVNGGAISQLTSSPFAGSGYARIVSSSTIYSGADYSFGTRSFVSGRTYRLQLAARTISGSAVVNLGLGDVGAGDRSTSTPTLASSWALYTLDWTASADRTAVSVTLRNNAAASNTFEVDEVEVFEAIDDLGADVSYLSWANVPGSVSGITVRVDNSEPNGYRYDPRNASGDLYGLLLPGRRILGRATYSNALYPLFHGTLRSIEVSKRDGTADLNANDTFDDLVRGQYAGTFSATRSYADARAIAVAAVVSNDPAIDSSAVGASRRSLTTGGIEADTFFDGTDGEDSAAGYLAEIDDATQSVGWCEPVASAVIGWRYRSVDRATLTDTSSDFTVDEDFEDLTGVKVSDDTLETRQVIPWQTYEPLTFPTWWDEDQGGYMLAFAFDAGYYGEVYRSDDDSPYLHFIDEELGTDDNHPEPRFRYPRGWSAKKWLRRSRKGLKVPRRTRIYPQSFFPFTMDASETRDVVVDFSVPVANLTHQEVGVGVYVVEIDKRPSRYAIEFVAFASATITWLIFYGLPYMPGDDMDETVDAFDAQATLGIYPGPSYSTPYIAAEGQAQGVGRFRNWRYSTPRLRPTLVDHNTFPRCLTARPTDHFTVSAGRWNIDATLFVSTGCRWEVTNKALEWRSFHDLEELPTHSAWFTLGSSLLGGTDVLAP